MSEFSISVDMLRCVSAKLTAPVCRACWWWWIERGDADMLVLMWSTHLRLVTGS
jgi:hypothetical protein